MKIKSGVLQGSTFGPNFLIIFINDLIHYIENKSPDHVTLTVFADDTNAIVSADSLCNL